MILKIAQPFRGKRRLRVRRVDEEGIARYTLSEARRKNNYAFCVDHGGSVCNSYKYPAETECVLAVAHPSGLVAVWCGRTPANKVTDVGAATACFPRGADMFDRRITNEERLEAARRAMIEAHSRLWSTLEVIAAVGDSDGEA